MNVINNMNRTLLHMAAISDCFEILAVLLKHESSHKQIDATDVVTNIIYYLYYDACTAPLLTFAICHFMFMFMSVFMSMFMSNCTYNREVELL